MKSWVLIIFLLLFSPCVNAELIDNLQFKGFIADHANLISDEVEYDLNMTIWDLQKKTGADIAVVTMPSLEDKSVEDAALYIGRTYKVGAKEKNNGIVFLTALEERRMRIEVGTGLDKRISMSVFENIRDNDILPYYKNNDYESGIARGTYKLVDVVAQAEGVNVTVQGTIPDSVKSASCYSGNKDVCSTCKRGELCMRHKGRYGCYPWWLWPIAIIMGLFSPRRRRFSLGTFGGFGGGGGFGGSGCSGGW